MKNYLSNLIKIREHKRLHKDWLNYFDPYSNDVTINGVLSRDELWQRELPNEVILTFYIFSILKVLLSIKR